MHHNLVVFLSATSALVSMRAVLLGTGRSKFSKASVELSYSRWPFFPTLISLLFHASDLEYRCGFRNDPPYKEKGVLNAR
jgi:hypothetical protein